MLPRNPNGAAPSGRYGDVAIVTMIRQFLKYGLKVRDLEAYIVGGGNLDNWTEFLTQTDDTLFTQEDRLSAWLNIPLGSGFDFYAMGSYTFEYIDEESDHYFDVDFLKFDGNFSTTGEGASNFGFTAGRFVTSDFTGYVFYHVMDGGQLRFRFPFVNINTSFGYTGLIFKHAADFRISKLDVVEANDDDIFLGPPKIIGVIDATFPDLIGNQTLTMSFVFQEDMRSEDDVLEEGEENFFPAEGGLLDTQYYGVGVGGPIFSSLYYNTFFYLSTGRTLSYLNDPDSATNFSYEYTGILSLLFGGGIKFYMRDFLYSRIAFSFVYASGDEDSFSFIEGNSDDRASTFVPISYDSDIALVFPPQLGNILLFDISYSLRPFSGSKTSILSNLQTMLKALIFFRPTSGPISEAGLDPTSDAAYLGTEIDLIINFRPFSDLGTALSLGLFVPNTGEAFLEDQRETEFLGRFEFSLSF
jgi:hypothetical protein